jgi:hypothetical protein
MNNVHSATYGLESLYCRVSGYQETDDSHKQGAEGADPQPAPAEDLPQESNPDAFRPGLGYAMKELAKWQEEDQMMEAEAAQFAEKYARFATNLANAKMKLLDDGGTATKDNCTDPNIPPMDRMRYYGSQSGDNSAQIQICQTDYQAINSKGEVKITAAQGSADGWNSSQQDIARQSQSCLGEIGSATQLWNNVCKQA